MKKYRIRVLKEVLNNIPDDTEISVTFLRTANGEPVEWSHNAEESYASELKQINNIEKLSYASELKKMNPSLK